MHACMGHHVGTLSGIISEVYQIQNEKRTEEETFHSRTLHSDVHRRIVCMRNHKNKYKLITISHLRKMWNKYYSTISELKCNFRQICSSLYGKSEGPSEWKANINLDHRIIIFDNTDWTRLSHYRPLAGSCEYSNVPLLPIKSAA